MNELLVYMGIESWKPFLGALLLPPVPFLLLILVAARLMFARRGLAWLLIVLSLSGIYFSGTQALAWGLEQWAFGTVRPLQADQIAVLAGEPVKQATIKPLGKAGLTTSAAKPVGPKETDTAIVVLGGGLEPFAPEYGVSNLGWASLERLRYGLWLAKQTKLPVLFSGGVGWGALKSDQQQRMPEADVAARIALEDFGWALTWTENQSRDTRENAAYTTRQLKAAGIKRIVLVTHGYHMRRALRAFQDAGRGEFVIEAAPMGLAKRVDDPKLDWMPSARGYQQVRTTLREVIGWWTGA